MHNTLKQLPLCIEMCEQVETILSKYLILSDETILDAREGETLFAFDHAVRREDRLVFWGISFSLDPDENDEDSSATVYITFKQADKTLLSLDFDPLDKQWRFAPTTIEKELLHKIMTSQKRLDALDDEEFEQITLLASQPHLSTEQALPLIARFAQWFNAVNTEPSS